jgi:hypothetical protein
MGLKPMEKVIQKDGMDEEFRMDVWNVLYPGLMLGISNDSYPRCYTSKGNALAYKWTVEMFKSPLMKVMFNQRA